MATTQTETIQALNQLLRGELAAVETYTQALTVLESGSKDRAQLVECQSSHARRVWRLRAEILERGGEPVQSSGPWGVFAKAVEGSAKVVGRKMAINALEAGEDHGIKEYQEVLPRLDGRARDVVSADFFMQQMHTHEVLSTLKERMSEAPRSRAS